MENPKALAIASLKDANNVLVTVSNNPSVDQLAGAIGFTLLLNKLGKHAAAVFSGNIPSTIEFLQPEQTIEKTTDSLRDFIIALDKSKADKLRYKVEDKMVKIFITPFRTSISQEDLDFSQGDFNIDVVLAVGAHEQQDLDSAITAHGRILHDATIVSVNNRTVGSLGSINWIDDQASSLCEMLSAIGIELKEDVLDAQMATALLTGIVAETDRFSNDRTSPATMSISSKLMAAGANQQLVATKLQENKPLDMTPADSTPADKSQNKDADVNDDGSLSISHADADMPSEPVKEQEQDDTSQPTYDSGHFTNDSIAKSVEIPKPENTQNTSALPETHKLILDPPTLGSKLTAASDPEDQDPSTDAMTLPPVSPPLLDHTPSGDDMSASSVSSVLQAASSPQDGNTAEPDVPETPEPPAQGIPTVVSPAPPQPLPTTNEPEVEDTQTLASLEEAVHSPHLQEQTSDIKGEGGVDEARNAVTQAVASGVPPTLEPITALNAQPIDLNPPQVEIKPATQSAGDGYLDITKLDENTGLPTNLVPPNDNLPADNTAAHVENPTAPPPVPPPMMPMTAPEEPHMLFGQQPLPNAEDDNDAQDPLAAL